MKSLQIVDRFSPTAKAMRAHFDEVFSDPKAENGERFAWDYWHVEGQYTQLRTPAYSFFPKKIYEKFHQELVWWGRRTLGCHEMRPTSISAQHEWLRATPPRRYSPRALGLCFLADAVDEARVPWRRNPPHARGDPRLLGAFRGA